MPKLSNETFNQLRFFAEIGAHALATFVLTVSAIWGFQYGEAIGATITAVGVLVGALVGVSRSNYAKEQEEKNE